MTTYYLSSVDGDNGSDGLSWDNAFATFKYAVETASAAASGPHLLYVDSAHSESLSADTTITAAADIRILCVNRSTGALATTAVVGAQAGNYSITIAGGFRVYVYGIIFRIPGSGTDILTLNNTDNGHLEYENCKFELTTTGTSSRMIFGIGGTSANRYTKLSGCTLKFGATAQYIVAYGCSVELQDCSVDPAGSAPTILLDSTADSNGVRYRYIGCDLSHITGTLIGDMAASGHAYFEFISCKFGAGVTVLEAATTVLNKGQTTVNVFNCASGDTHYVMGHYDAFGETTVSATIYANDGASYDGTNKCSWKIVTTANCSYYTPYVSPWMDVYHSGTSAISPYLEILRSGSTTKYQNDEVWGEFSYQGTSGSTKATLVNDRMTPLGTAADQTASSLDASGWTGEDATNNAFMKLEAGSITPAEIGHIRARVCVGEPSITVYVDPKIRGLS